MKQYLSAFIFLLLLNTHALAADSGNTVRADVNGLVCDFCARSIEKMFSKQKAVASVEVNLDKKIIRVHIKQGKKLDDAKITEIINNAGYDVRELTYE